MHICDEKQSIDDGKPGNTNKDGDDSFGFLDDGKKDDNDNWCAFIRESDNVRVGIWLKVYPKYDARLDRVHSRSAEHISDGYTFSYCVSSTLSSYS